MFQEWIFGYRTIGLMKRLIKSIVRPRKTWNEIKYWSIGKHRPKIFKPGYYEIDQE